MQIQVARTGHPFQGHIVKITTGHLGNRSDPFFGRGGRQQVDRVHIDRPQRLGKGLGFFRGVINNQNTICTSLFGRCHECGDPHAFDRVGVTHQHHGCFLIGLAELPQQRQGLMQTHPMGNRPLGSTLDHGPVGHGIREGYAKLDDVCPTLDQRMQQRNGQFRRRIARHDVGDEPLAALFRQCGKGVSNTAHLLPSALQSLTLIPALAKAVRQLCRQ